jgi:hypothetical protein
MINFLKFQCLEVMGEPGKCCIFVEKLLHTPTKKKFFLGFE